jgi:hypothetical protein
MRKIFAALIGVVMIASAPAHARGLIAKHVIAPIAGKHAAREADKQHEKAGKPLDVIAKAARDAAVAAAAAAAAQELDSH